MRYLLIIRLGEFACGLPAALRIAAFAAGLLGTRLVGVGCGRGLTGAGVGVGVGCGVAATMLVTTSFTTFVTTVGAGGVPASALSSEGLSGIPYQ